MEQLQSTILSKLTSGMPSPMRLRDLIRQIRAARTAADERAVIQKECAYIRSTFREEDNVWRCRNVAKLLYIHMLGYPAHFGQLECLKLIASPRFTDKRIGYLGAMLLLDERQDVHLLITNSLKNDLNSQTQFIVGLALCALGAICSPEMSRDLAGEIERLMKSSNTYIKKKAILCAARIVRKVPELMEVFIPVSRTILNEKNHGVLVTGVTLITEICEQSSDTQAYFKKMVPNLVRILKNLTMAGYSPEHDVCGVSDPFLQVKILRLLRLLGRDDVEASEAMNDILAQVATNTENSKNVGNAILYETVISIMDIKSESGLRVLGVNILGRFLLNTDKNIRFVALTTLMKTVIADYNAVQRHRTTIVECLKDPDVSIRKKAMELCFALINANNIKSMSKELIAFLEKADPEFKAVCSSNLCLAAEKHAPGSKWHIDTMINVLKTAGNFVRDDVVGNLIQLISDTGSYHAYTVHQLWKQISNEADLAMKQPLTQVSLWVIGEYGDLLLSPDPEANNGSTVEHDVIIDKCEALLVSNLMSLVTKEYASLALIKLSVRLPDYAPKIKKIVDGFGSHVNAELQQRATEFASLFTRYDNLRPSVLERMPPMKPLDRKRENGVVPETNGDLNHELSPTVDIQHSAGSALLDLLDIAPNSPEVSPVKSSELTSTMGLASGNLLDDLLGLNLGNNPSATNNIPNQSLQNTTLNDTSSANQSTDDFLGDLTLPNGASTKAPQMIVLDKAGLRITFDFESPSSNGVTLVNMTATNSLDSPITEFLFQAAVPKTFQLQFTTTPSSTVVPPNNSGTLVQTIKVANPNKSPLRMRVKVSYNLNGNNVLEQVELNSFPALD
ncbi:AP-1 complex subunit gamma-1 [Halotydeus destructor]|nr:AP-1 complex subunit gamma-1 [Halotydeus destructor]